MVELSSFWSGASRVADAAEVLALRDVAGSWAALERASVDDLAAWGVPLDRARRWLGAGVAATRGTPITVADAGFPAQILPAPGAPAVLFAEGDLSLLGRRSVAVVGTRRSTSYGEAVAHHLGAELSKRSVPIISGLAAGIDGAAHRGSRGCTVAVLGHGLSHTSPAHHRELRSWLLRQGGCVVSSFPDPLPPERWTFPVRNRWIAALSAVVVVVEAPAKSGALLTAAEAAGMGRPVYAVPGPLGAPQSEGCLRLLVDGAHLVDHVERFADHFGLAQPEPPDRLLDVMGLCAHPDQIAARLGWPLADVLRHLSRLEVEGRVVRAGGQRYLRAGGVP